MKQWDEQFPGPGYEAERAWEIANPSPIARHRRLRSSVEKPLDEIAENLMLRIKLGEVKADEVYTEIQQVAELINERAGSIIGGSR